MGTEDSTPKPGIKRGHDKPAASPPLTKDEALRRRLDAGPLAAKQAKVKKRPHGGATTTPKPKPQKGK